MNKKLIIRADDLGFSKAVNYGIYESVKNGLCKSVGLMPNMPTSEMGFYLIKDICDCIGQHTNICLGKPCADPSLIPSLLDENGNFRSSKAYREAYKNNQELTVLDEMIIEVEAQYDRFIEICHKKPAYFEGHAVMCNNLSKALEIVAKKHDLKYLEMRPSGSLSPFNGVPVYNMPIKSVLPGEYDPMECLKEGLKKGTKKHPNVFITHPGYIDQFLCDSSSLTWNRMKEVEMLTSDELYEYLQKNNIDLITYNEVI